jgi:hypothetical protein
MPDSVFFQWLTGKIIDSLLEDSGTKVIAPDPTRKYGPRESASIVDGACGLTANPVAV